MGVLFSGEIHSLWQSPLWEILIQGKGNGKSEVGCLDSIRAMQACRVGSRLERTTMGDDDDLHTFRMFLSPLPQAHFTILRLDSEWGKQAEHRIKIKTKTEFPSWLNG